MLKTTHECCICFNLLEEGLVIIHPVNPKACPKHFLHHIFHATCIEPWMRQKLTCPFCRTPLKNEVTKLSPVQFYKTYQQSHKTFPNAQILNFIPKYYKEDIDVIISLAARDGMLELVKQLLIKREEALPEQANYNGEIFYDNAISVAAKNGYIPILTPLLQHKNFSHPVLLKNLIRTLIERESLKPLMKEENEDSGNIQALKCLSDHLPIDPQFLKEAIQLAQDSDSEECVQILQSWQKKETMKVFLLALEATKF